MAHIQGKLGGIFVPQAYIRSYYISFRDNAPNRDTISISNGDFLEAGFQTGQNISVIGSSLNDGLYTIYSVSQSTITLISSDSLQNEDEGADVKIVTLAPGVQLGGFYNWSITWEAGVSEVTDFADEGWRVYISSLKGWTASAEWYFDTNEEDPSEWLGKDVYLRFFLKYVQNPSAQNKAYYLEGAGIVTRDNPSASVDEPVSGRFDIQGVGALAYVEKEVW